MNRTRLTNMRRNARQNTDKTAVSLLIVLAPMMLGGCVQVSAPEKPIEINLNINIRQEVVVRLQQDARELIKKNPGVF